MSDVIRLLPDSVANQIAAGEVIQRPASVVKELVENAVDAGATRIQVVVKDAGRTLIQVVDDGKGMSDTDARLAFERHATSKIRQADDLFSLHTMGFRGEALASIAAVAQVDLRTMQHRSEIGTRIIINGSKVESQQPEACAPGTNMMVKNLFFNVPVRRKFLKKDAVELSNISREFERMALVNPGVDLSLTHNDSVMHSLIRSSLKQRICDLFGKGLEKQLIPVGTKTSIVTIDGFVCLPEFARKRNQLQYLTVNGRHMRHPYFHKAVMQCYERLIPADQQPNYFLNFTVAPETIDVNIHPTKNEIKFENEAAIWQILTAAVREALGRFNAGPAIDFENADAPEIPVFNPNAEGQHSVEIDPSYNPFASAAGGTSAPRTFGSGNSLRRTGAIGDWEKLYEGFIGESEAPDEAPQIHGSKLNALPAEDLFTPAGEEVAKSAGAPAADAPAETGSIQVKNRYIMSAAASGLMVIDQHRAHVKVLYERYRQQIRTGECHSQQVLFPEVVTLSPDRDVTLRDLGDTLSAVGYDLASLGGRDWSINAVPSVVSGCNPAELLTGIIDDMAEGRLSAWQEVTDSIALSMARRSAIKAGQRLTPEEREHLIGELLKLPTPNYTPDGHQVITLIETDEIAARLQ